MSCFWSLLHPVSSELHDQDHLDQYLSSDPKLIKKLTESFHMDDVVTGASNE